MKRPDAIPPLARRPETRRYIAVLAAVNLAIIAVLAGILYLHQRADRDRSLRMFEYHQGIASQSHLAIRETALLQRDMAVAGGPDSATGDRLNILRLSDRTIRSLQARYADTRFDEPTARAVQAFGNLYDRLPMDDPGTIAEPGAVSEALDRLSVHLDQLARLHMAASYDMVNDPRGPRILDTRVLLLLFVALIGAGGILNTVIVRRFETATTERGNAVAALRQSDATLHDERNLVSAILDTANALIVVLDRDGRIVRFNRACELLSGYAAADILGTCVWDRLLPEDDIEPVKQIFRRLTEHKVPGEFESPWLTKDGKPRLISWNNSVITDQSGNVEFMVSVGIDVTERRAISDRLVHTADGLKKAQRIACLGSWEWDINSGALDWSDEIYRMLGAEPGSIDVSFDTFKKIVHPDDWPSVEQAINRSLDEGSPYSVEHRMVRPDGSERIIHETGEVEFDSDNKPCLMRGTAQDITEIRRLNETLRESEELFRAAFDQAAVGILLTEADGRFKRANPKMCEILGFSEDELIGMTYLDVTHPDDLEASANRHIELHKRKLGSLPLEKRYIRKDGTVIWARVTISLMRDEEGNHLGNIGFIEDIDDRKKAEQALAETALSLAEAQRIGQIGSWELDPESGTLTWSEENYRLLGLDPESFTPTYDALLEMIHPDDRERMVARNDAAKTAGTVEPIEYRLIRPDGETRVLQSRGEIVHNDDGTIRLRGTVQDITDWKRAEQAVRDSEARLNAFFTEAPVGLGIIDHERRYVVLNEALARSNGLPVADHIGKTPSELFPAEMAKMVESVMDRTLVGGEHIINEEASATTPDGKTRHWAFSQFPLPGDGKIAGALGVAATDITELKQAQRKLGILADNLAEAQRIANLGSWDWTPKEDREWWSDEHYRIFGLEPQSVELDAYGFLRYVHPDDRKSIDRIMRKAERDDTPYSVEYRVVWPDGTERVVIERGEVTSETNGVAHWSGTVQDITDRKRIEEELASLNTRLEARVEERTAELHAAQEELVKSERLATLGHLTATVSHELRNPLGAIRTSMYIIEKVADISDDRLARSVERINRSVTRCDNIIDELLDFTRIQNLEPAETLLDRWLGVLLSEQVVPEGIEVRRKFGAPEIRVMADTDRLRRAVINVYENACHALAQASEAGGKRTCRITVETRVRRNRYEIILSDSGDGIPEETLPKIFEPLFSTKNFGVGLGLPTVKQIMEQHSGGVEAGNGRRQGARFVLWLPLVPEMQEIEG